ncbi:transglycosylase SLT domain-containing protein [Mangrovimonas cancribranchiae]|uniref:Transglycosylase SLT domain-containing protein n=1 Tax=Mangrovimonas cancribranchiae TaxID=3080055 RepID=A0AAU6NWY2_9FLAO
MLIYESQVPASYRQEFIDAVRYYANKLSINPNWLMAVMYFESAKTFSPSVQNPYTNATGLIQFMPATANELGTSINALKNMTAAEQMYYVYKYYVRYKSKLKSYVDLYLITFFPLAAGKPLNFILQTATLPASLIANQNPVFDLDNNGQVTVGEIQKVMLNKIPASWINEFKKKRY